MTAEEFKAEFVALCKRLQVEGGLEPRGTDAWTEAVVDEAIAFYATDHRPAQRVIRLANEARQNASKR